MNQQSLVTTDFLAMAQSQSDGFYKLTEVKLQIVKIGKTNLKKNSIVLTYNCTTGLIS